MSKFNASTRKTIAPDTENLAGGQAFSQNAELELASVLLTSFVANQYYRSANDTLQRIGELVGAVDPYFAAQAAVFTRTEFGMRSTSHVVAAHIAQAVKGQEWTKRFFDRVVFRPDDMSEIIGYYGQLTGSIKPLPNAMKKGFAQAFRRFDAYQLGKYRMEGKDIALVDVANLVRPTPTAAINKLMKGELKSETYQTGLTQAGQKADSEEEKQVLKKDVWKKFLDNEKVEYFALLRNLRNIQQQAPEYLDQALAVLTDAKRIKKSKVMPFRFITALEQFNPQTNRGWGRAGKFLASSADADTRKIIKALSRALDISVDNVPELDGDTLVCLDVSGSMSGQLIQIASLFAAALVKGLNADLMAFEGHARYLNYDPTASVSSLAESFSFPGGSTNFRDIFMKANKKYDRVIILSDMQAWVGYNAPTDVFNQYKRTFGADPKVFSFDLAGHGTLQFPERNVYALAGFSEKVFDIMGLLDQDPKALVNRIKQVEV